MVDFDSGLIQDPGVYETWFRFQEEVNPSLIFPYIRVGQLELPRINLEDPVLERSLRLEWFRIIKEAKKMPDIPEEFSYGAKVALSNLIKRGWTMFDRELHDAQLRDLSNYSEAFAEARWIGQEEGFMDGKAEGFMDGMKAMARKMLELGEPLEKVVSLTGLSEAELLQ